MTCPVRIVLEVKCATGGVDSAWRAEIGRQGTIDHYTVAGNFLVNWCVHIPGEVNADPISAAYANYVLGRSKYILKCADVAFTTLWAGCAHFVGGGTTCVRSCVDSRASGK